MRDTNKILNDIYRKDLVKRYINLILGCFILAIAYNIFCVPNDLNPGGVSGFAIALNEIIPIDRSLFILIVDIFLLVLSYFLLGKEKTKHSILGSILFPIFIKLTSNINSFLNIEVNVLLLSTLFAGILEGLGSGLIFKDGFSSGGSDIINQILSKYLKISIGNAMYISNGIILLFSGYVFGINKMMYAIILIYIMGYITDKVILGISSSKAFYIITKEDKKVKDFIIKELKHSVTVINAEGGFNHKKQKVLMCVLPTREYFKLKEGINNIDSDVFFVVTDSYEVVGGA